mmetsp:Transcript_25312/g.74319  ORF Transcript_25312/g.74319 Transcript_25312/m.74319 type:complete len:444 (+) Transcript_25312:95-1426(+)
MEQGCGGSGRGGGRGRAGQGARPCPAVRDEGAVGGELRHVAAADDAELEVRAPGNESRAHARGHDADALAGPALAPAGTTARHGTSAQRARPPVQRRPAVRVARRRGCARSIHLLLHRALLRPFLAPATRPAHVRNDSDRLINKALGVVVVYPLAVRDAPAEDHAIRPRGGHGRVVRRPLNGVDVPRMPHEPRGEAPRRCIHHIHHRPAGDGEVGPRVGEDRAARVHQGHLPRGPEGVHAHLHHRHHVLANHCEVPAEGVQRDGGGRAVLRGVGEDQGAWAGVRVHAHHAVLAAGGEQRLGRGRGEARHGAPVESAEEEFVRYLHERSGPLCRVARRAPARAHGCLVHLEAEGAQEAPEGECAHLVVRELQEHIRLRGGQGDGRARVHARVHTDEGREAQPFSRFVLHEDGHGAVARAHEDAHGEGAHAGGAEGGPGRGRRRS